MPLEAPENPEEKDPEPVAAAEAVYHALTSEQPKTRYLILQQRAGRNGE